MARQQLLRGEHLATSNIVRLGEIIRKRRRQLELTQKEVATRIKTSKTYVGYLESGKRRPTETTIARLAKALLLDKRELFSLAYPWARSKLAPTSNDHLGSAWEQFKNDSRVRRLYNISNEEMRMLSQVVSLGEVRSPREFIYVLNAVRHAINPAFDENPHSAWKQFKNDDRVRRLYNVSDAEMEMLTRVASLGKVRSARDFMYVLNAVRQIMGR